MEETTWKDEFKQVLPLLGHRNWILIVDKAYPLQSGAGIKYLNTNLAVPTVLKQVMDDINSSSHIKPIVYTDKELRFLNESLVPGIDSFKGELNNALNGVEIQNLLHDDVFSKLDAASKLFSVVVLKTETTYPYTSVFIELDCGYWSGDKEQTLRESMK